MSLMVVVVALVAGVGYLAVKSSEASNCTISPILVNSCRPWLGAYVVDYPGLSSYTGLPQVQGEEQRTGAHLDIVHTDYHSWTEDQLTSEEIAIANESNQYAWLNWKPAPNWADGDGGDNAVNANIKNMADSIKKSVPASHKIFITPWHEPNNDVSSGPVAGCPAKGHAGTPAQYVAMWKNVETIFSNEGVHNVIWGILYEEFPPLDCWDQALYPGKSLVDWIGFDSYGNGGSSDAFQNSVGAGYKYLVKLGGEPNTSTSGWMQKPVVIGEWGSCRASYSSQTNADYFADAKYALDKNLYPDIKAYMIFDAPGTGFENPAGNHYPGGCQLGYQQDGKATDSIQQKAYNAFADDPIFNGSKSTPPPSATPKPSPTPNPSSTPRPGGGSPYCAAGGKGLCGSDEGNTSNGSKINGEQSSSGNNQNVTVQQNTGACQSGTVTGTCPFKLGSGNNTKFEGDTIDTIANNATGKCWAAPSGSGVVLDPCTDSGTNWVGIKLSSGIFEWINVYETDHNNNNLQWLFTAGSLHSQLQVGTTGASKWSH